MEIQEINLNLINEPTHAMRSDAWGDDIESLADSIKQFGLIQPITVQKVGDRYEVIAGHRRLLAHKHLGFPFISAIVREVEGSDLDAMKVHENLYRADINPVDQAVFIFEYQERYNLSIEDLAKQLNRSVSWVNSRLQILTYPEYLIEFVGEGKLSMATAELLNQITNDAIKEKFCRDASIIGLSATRAKFWLAQANLNASNSNFSTVEMPADEYNPEPTRVLMFRCAIDDVEYPADQMEMVYVLPANLKIIKDALASGDGDSQCD